MHNKRVYDIKIAIERLKNYCALQDRCQWDVTQKMKEWGLLEMTQNHILEILIQEKYVDEERFTQSFCRGKFLIKKWGKVKITNELKKKKISDICIKKGLEEIDLTSMPRSATSDNNNTISIHYFLFVIRNSSENYLVIIVLLNCLKQQKRRKL